MPAVFGHRSFALLWSARVLSTLAFHVQAVAVGWQLYALTGSALDLGLIGLVQFVPMVLLSLIAGQAADRYDRRLILIVCQIVKAAVDGEQLAEPREHPRYHGDRRRGACIRDSHPGGLGAGRRAAVPHRAGRRLVRLRQPDGAHRRPSAGRRAL